MTLCYDDLLKRLVTYTGWSYGERKKGQEGKEESKRLVMLVLGLYSQFTSHLLLVSQGGISLRCFGGVPSQFEWMGFAR